MTYVTYNELGRHGRSHAAPSGWCNLMLAGIAPFIDGRLDMYGEKLLRGAARSTRSWPTTRSHGLCSSPTIIALHRLPGWRRLHADTVAVERARDLAR